MSYWYDIIKWDRYIYKKNYRRNYGKKQFIGIENINSTYTEVVKLQTEVKQNKESFEVSVSQLTQTINSNNNSTQENIDNINNTISNGVELVKNSLVTIDINGISVSTNTSAISTLMSNDKFSIKTKSGEELFFVGYDYNLQKTVSRIDNLTVTNYLTSGYHRTEGIEIDGEYRTCDFYIGAWLDGNIKTSKF